MVISKLIHLVHLLLLMVLLNNLRYFQIIVHVGMLHHVDFFKFKTIYGTGTKATKLITF
jgi:hypothetical protein